MKNKTKYLIALIEDKILLLFCVLRGVDGYKGGWRPL